MELRALLALALVLVSTFADAGPRRRPLSAPDPGAIYYEAGNVAALQVAPGLGVYQTPTTIRALSINPVQKTLILISAGQSIPANSGTGAFAPVNAAAIDNFSPVIGENYAAANPLIGAFDRQNSFVLQLADAYVTAGTFNRVIIVPVPLSGTQIGWWAGTTVPGAGDIGQYYRTILSAINKLKARGVTPSTTGTVWAVLWNQGESDCQAGTSQADYTNAFNTMFGYINAAIPGVRWFVARESWIIGVTCAAITNAQTALVNGTQIFSAGNMDSIGAGGRQPDNTHLNGAGQASAASLTLTAMQASGSPF